MNLQIAMFLGQDGVTNGAIYALLALSILLVFTVTRVLFIPQGEFVAFGALTMATLQAGQVTAVVWLLAGMTVVVTTLDLLHQIRNQGRVSIDIAGILKLAYPFALALALYQLPLATLPMAIQALLTFALIVPLGPLFYRLFYQPISSAPVLVLLIVSIAVHVAMVGTGLLIFGPSGARTLPFSDASFPLGPITLNSQTLWVIAASLALIIALYQFFERTIYGKALRATAINRAGARLMGISPVFAGKASFFLAAFIGTLSGILIAPITTIYYDSGFLISLKGFIGSIIGGLVSYPVAALGALLVGMIEAFSAFWASTYKEVIVFTLIIPFLLWRSLTVRHVEEEE
ncbi:MAG: branched-chain amino acid ABC transporter permease [Azoarcus sp.]|jgi:branched-chain amino acid transport system permease protein|nr:branched-chain amino acid ABC transporter permease [Azoarcus sp.]MDD2875265.1 branched-chain amino acid ABC transporter permease [Azoarcus sp.]MDX9838166.1 branched-chain amino acid ABC transporter permease [Azoarcus sp.]